MIAKSADENSLLIPIRTGLPWRNVFAWLRAGWADYAKCWRVSAWFGLCFVVMGWVQLLIFQHAPAYSMALISGFLLAGPFLCTAVYQLSQTLERGQQPRFLPAALAFRPVLANIGIFAAVLLVLELLWGRASLVVFALFYKGGLPTTKDLLAALAKFSNVDFLIAYILVGAIFATLVFVVSAVAIPMHHGWADERARLSRFTVNACALGSHHRYPDAAGDAAGISGTDRGGSMAWACDVACLSRSGCGGRAYGQPFLKYRIFLRDTDDAPIGIRCDTISPSISTAE